MNRSAVVVVSALLGVAVGVPGPVGAATTVAAVPASIPSDCSRDVSAELLAWIASVPDGSTLRFAANGCYRVDRTLTIQYRNGLTFEGNGATFPRVHEWARAAGRTSAHAQHVQLLAREQSHSAQHDRARCEPECGDR